MNFFIKDLSKIGRDLSKTIIVDNTPENFQLQAQNGICIKTWIGDEKDHALHDLGEILGEIGEECRTTKKDIR